jgi:hypothetical protein
VAKNKDYFTTMDTPYMVQPPKGAAEGPIEYGGVTNISEAKDPMGVMPPDAKQHNIGPRGGEG